MTTATFEPALLKVEEAAQRLRIGRSKAYAMAAAGTLPGVVRVGGSIRVSARALDRWIEFATATQDAPPAV